MQPVNVWIPGEQEVPGVPPVPFEFRDMAFLSKGVGPDENGNIWGPLDPWPQLDGLTEVPFCEMVIEEGGSEVEESKSESEVEVELEHEMEHEEEEEPESKPSREVKAENGMVAPFSLCQILRVIQVLIIKRRLQTFQDSENEAPLADAFVAPRPTKWAEGALRTQQ